MTEEKKKPALRLKLGRVNAAVFANESERGKWYTLSLDRVYVDGKEFKRTSNFPHQELDNLELAVQRARDWIAKQGK